MRILCKYDTTADTPTQQQGQQNLLSLLKV